MQVRTKPPLKGLPAYAATRIAFWFARAAVNATAHESTERGRLVRGVMARVLNQWRADVARDPWALPKPWDGAVKLSDFGALRLLARRYKPPPQLPRDCDCD